MNSTEMATIQYRRDITELKEENTKLKKELELHQGTQAEAEAPILSAECVCGCSECECVYCATCGEVNLGAFLNAGGKCKDPDMDLCDGCFEEDEDVPRRVN